MFRIRPAVFVETLAAALGIVERVPIGREDRVAVIGDGKRVFCVHLPRHYNKHNFDRQNMHPN